jgi:DNA-binding helix-turn-helix protein
MKDDIKYKLGRNIKIERIRKDITQERFAELIDMSVSYVSKVEQGLTSPTAIALFKMSYILKTPMEEFFKGIDYEKLSS